MSTPASQTSSAPQHPAPHRGNVSSAMLAFGLLAAPAAWALDELLQYFIASRVCGMRSAHADMTLSRADSPWFMAVVLLTFLVTLAGVWAALDCWRRSRGEREGEKHHLVERGEGRTRFLAMAGLVTSAGFAVAFLFMIAEMYSAPLCP